MTSRLVILDRDGVINADSDDHIKSVAEWRPLPGSLEAIARLNRAGFTVALATNQSGMARGLFDEATLEAIHAHMNARLAPLGGSVDPIAYSPHGPDSSDPMRKPGPGMLQAIAQRLDTALDGVPYVGDSWSDIEAARAAGARPVLVRTGRGPDTLAGMDTLADISVHDDLADFVEHWLAARDDAAD